MHKGTPKCTAQSGPENCSKWAAQFAHARIGLSIDTVYTFGESPTLPHAKIYDPLRAPNVTLRGGGRFFETAPQGKCTVGEPPSGDAVAGS